MSKTIGSPVHTRLGSSLVAAVDTWAAIEDLTRAEAIRVLLFMALYREAQDHVGNSSQS